LFELRADGQREEGSAMGSDEGHKRGNLLKRSLHLEKTFLLLTRLTNMGLFFQPRCKKWCILSASAHRVDAENRAFPFSCST